MPAARKQAYAMRIMNRLVLRQADDEYSASLTPEERVDDLLTMIERCGSARGVDPSPRRPSYCPDVASATAHARPAVGHEPLKPEPQQG
jgi:hypothetical protein